MRRRLANSCKFATLCLLYLSTSPTSSHANPVDTHMQYSGRTSDLTNNTSCSCSSSSSSLKATEPHLWPTDAVPGMNMREFLEYEYNHNFELKPHPHKHQSRSTVHPDSSLPISTTLFTNTQGSTLPPPQPPAPTTAPALPAYDFLARRNGQYGDPSYIPTEIKACRSLEMLNANLIWHARRRSLNKQKAPNNNNGGDRDRNLDLDLDPQHTSQAAALYDNLISKFLPYLNRRGDNKPHPRRDDLPYGAISAHGAETFYTDKMAWDQAYYTWMQRMTATPCGGTPPYFQATTLKPKSWTKETKTKEKTTTTTTTPKATKVTKKKGEGEKKTGGDGRVKALPTAGAAGGGGATTQGPGAPSRGGAPPAAAPPAAAAAAPPPPPPPPSAAAAPPAAPPPPPPPPPPAEAQQKPAPAGGTGKRRRRRVRGDAGDGVVDMNSIPVVMGDVEDNEEVAEVDTEVVKVVQVFLPWGEVLDEREVDEEDELAAAIAGGGNDGGGGGVGEIVDIKAFARAAGWGDEEEGAGEGRVKGRGYGDVLERGEGEVDDDDEEEDEEGEEMEEDAEAGGMVMVELDSPGTPREVDAGRVTRTWDVERPEGTGMGYGGGRRG